MEGSTRSGKGLRHNTFTVRNRKGVTTQITHQPRRIRHVKHTKHPRRSRRPTHRRNTGASPSAPQPGKPTSPNTSKEPNSSKNVTGKRIHTRYFNYRFLLSLPTTSAFLLSGLFVHVLPSFFHASQILPQPTAQEFVYIHGLLPSSFFLKQCTSILRHLLSGDVPQTLLCLNPPVSN